MKIQYNETKDLHSTVWVRFGFFKSIFSAKHISGSADRVNEEINVENLLQAFRSDQ